MVPGARNAVVAATLVGAALRFCSLWANYGFPHGDVILDGATAESLAAGRGFWTPWEEGVTFREDALPQAGAPFGHLADQHGPLWPLLGAPIVWGFGARGVLALQIVSLLVGILAIPVAGLAFSKFGERAGRWAMWAIALLLPLSDYSGNGSLYSAQVLGVLILPVVAGNLAGFGRALGSGALLGGLFLLNYQCVVLIPAFAIAAVVATGWKRALPTLAAAAAGCLAVALPWFVRNFAAFGDPLYTTNIDYVVHQLEKHTISMSGPRPSAVSNATAADFAAGLRKWVVANSGYWITTIHLALPVLCFFAPGGFARMLEKSQGGRRTFAGAFLFFAFAGFFLMSVAWPTPKARYAIPLIAILAGAGMVELVAGARFLFAILTAAFVVAVGVLVGLGLEFHALAPFAFITIPQGSFFPNRESSYLLFTLFVPLLALHPRLRSRLPAIALGIVTLHGAFRVAVSLDKELCARVFHIQVAGKSMFGPPTATFYDVLSAPFTEGFELMELYDLKRATMRLREAGAKRIIAPVEISTFFDGEIVSLPPMAKRFDLGVLPRTLEVFQCDGVVVPREFEYDPAVIQAMQSWALWSNGVQVYGINENAMRFLAYKFPSPR